ncbi:LysR substrate-binding domain-containing protein [Pseudorhodoferax soli]|uniref:LysR family transcriptional regulator n=1 Tax=Pseudorhodoferax soli TaxID=545864 RepID=A0A368XNS8_9BURK|nr:LysR substrate-binding domain-containing protein [Pseudorhodoferax soli]RCW68668.1 LysR family transcriptional regulator [Pseudorhodoferax soli]
MLDSRRLRYFLAVADALHFGRAAERLNISQPPLSRQIASLEEDLGTALFHRNAHHVVLTPAGTRLQSDARDILASMARAEANARAAAIGESGALTIGFTMCAAYSVVPSYAKTFSTRYPEVDLTLREVLSSDLAAQVSDGTIDAAVVLAQAVPKGINQRTVVREQLCLALPRAHRLSSQRRIVPAALRDEVFVAASMDIAPSLRQAMLAQCEMAGFVPRIGMEVHLQQTILTLVAEGVGVALVPASMRKLQTSAIVFKSLPDAVSISQQLIWRATNSNPCLHNLLSIANPVE